MEQLLYVLYGNDPVKIKERLAALIQEKHIETEAVEMYDYEESSLDDVLDSAMTIPFLTDNKAVVLTSATFLSGEKAKEGEELALKRLDDYLSNPNPTTLLILIVMSEKLDSRKALVKKLTDFAVIENLGKAEKGDLFAEVRSKIQAAGLHMDANALQLFLTRVGDDPLTLKHELDKLLLYAMGMSKIDIETVKSVTIRNPEENIFLLVNAILEGDRQSVLRIYQDLRSASVDPIWMMGVIMNKFQEILEVQAYLRQKTTQEELMKIFGASKGRAYYMMKNARETDPNALYESISRLEKLDFDIKSGRVDKALGVEMFLFRVISE